MTNIKYTRTLQSHYPKSRKQSITEKQACHKWQCNRENQMAKKYISQSQKIATAVCTHQACNSYSIIVRLLCGKMRTVMVEQ